MRLVEKKRDYLLLHLKLPVLIAVKNLRDNLIMSSYALPVKILVILSRVSASYAVLYLHRKEGHLVKPVHESVKVYTSRLMDLA